MTPTQNHVCCERSLSVINSSSTGDGVILRRKSLENIEGCVLNSSSDGVVLRRKPHGMSNESFDTSSGRPTPLLEPLVKEYPRSADILERNRRSRSEERYGIVELLT